MSHKVVIRFCTCLLFAMAVFNMAVAARAETDAAVLESARRATGFVFTDFGKVNNQTNAPEAADVIDALDLEYPLELPVSAKFTLVRVHDGSEFRRNGNAALRELGGSYSARPVAGSSGGPMLWGIYEKWGPGSYLIVYRTQALSQVTGQRVCFLDVCTGCRTIAAHHPDAAEFVPGKWSCIPIHLNLAKPTNLEFRLWPSDHAIALDRVYIFQVH